MALFTDSLGHLQGWSCHPDAKGTGGRRKMWYAGHLGEMLGFTFSGSIRNCQEFYKQASCDKPLIKAMKSVIRDQAAGRFDQGSYGGPRVKGGR